MRNSLKTVNVLMHINHADVVGIFGLQEKPNIWGLK